MSKFWMSQLLMSTDSTFWRRCTLNFLGDRTNYKAKDIIEKLQIYFVPTFFK
jgi:hypothetical protein